jgi:nucleotide-binding universal stress UspA family protein
MLQHVLVAYDGSEGAKHALAFARRLLAPDGVLTLLRAVELPVPYVIGGFDGVVTLGEMPTAAELDRERVALLAAVADLGTRGRVRVELGHPVEVVTRLADELQPDVVVVGARGLGAVTRFLVGSVSDRIVHHCTRPVLIVR